MPAMIEIKGKRRGASSRAEETQSPIAAPVTSRGEEFFGTILSGRGAKRGGQIGITSDPSRDLGAKLSKSDGAPRRRGKVPSLKRKDRALARLFSALFSAKGKGKGRGRDSETRARERERERERGNT